MAGWAAAGSAIAGIGSGIASAMASARQARKQRDWQKKMYQHRYQYTMDDMRRAGLNPILAYRQGVGGGVPSGAMGRVPDLAASGAAGAAAGTKGSLATKQRKLVEQQTATSASSARTLDATAGKEKNLGIKALYDADKAATETRLLEYGEPQARLSEQYYNSAAGVPTVRAQEAGRAAGTIFNSAKSAVDIFSRGGRR